MRWLGITGMILYLIFHIFVISSLYFTELQHFDPLGAFDLCAKINLIHLQNDQF